MSLEVRNLQFAYGAHKVLEGIDFSVKPGELAAVLGPNGTGKTTLFKCVLGFLPHYTGSITIDGEQARTLPPRELAKRIAYIPQNHQQTFGYSVIDMVLMGTAHSLSLFSLPGAAQKKAAYEALERLGIASLAEKNISRISGGEQQLVLIARAIAQQAKLLIMDEPTASLDYGNRDKVLRLVSGLAKEGFGILVSTHDPQHALSYANKVIALKSGKVLSCGAPEAVITPELLSELYGMKTVLLDTPAGKVILPA